VSCEKVEIQLNNVNINIENRIISICQTV
jgi:hypothetical protein